MLFGGGRRSLLTNYSLNKLFPIKKLPNSNPKFPASVSILTAKRFGGDGKGALPLYKAANKYIEPTGFLWNRRPGYEFSNHSWAEKVSLRFLLQLMILTLFAYYKPNSNPSEWAESQARDRIRRRGIDLEDF